MWITSLRDKFSAYKGRWWQELDAPSCKCLSIPPGGQYLINHVVIVGKRENDSEIKWCADFRIRCFPQQMCFRGHEVSSFEPRQLSQRKTAEVLCDFSLYPAQVNNLYVDTRPRRSRGFEWETQETQHISDAFPQWKRAAEDTHSSLYLLWKTFRKYFLFFDDLFDGVGWITFPIKVDHWGLATLERAQRGAASQNYDCHP